MDNRTLEAKTMADLEELKPCPFCGGDAERIDIEDGENAGGSCICCRVCQASSNLEFGRKENFVSNWNRRAGVPAQLKAMTVADEIVSRALAATHIAENEPRFVDCARCNGKGYHHGFGENGHDPDWCSECGGGGVSLAEGEERRPMRAALEAAIPALIERVEKAEAAAKHLQNLNADAHAIVGRIWAIFGTPSYEALAGRTIYDLVQDAVTRAEAAEAENARMREALKTALDQIKALKSHPTASEEAHGSYMDARNDAALIVSEIIDGLPVVEAEPLLSTEEKRAQAARCSCYGADDYCPCQNVADAHTKATRAAIEGTKP